MVVYETGLDVNTPVIHSSPICTGTVRPISPSRPDPLVVPSCAGDVQVSSPPSVAPLVAHPSAEEARNPSPTRNNLVDVNPGNIAMAGNSEKAPSLDMSAKSGVRTRNQKNCAHSGRASPSPTLS